VTTLLFTPQASGGPPFSALVTLDGRPYRLAAMWNLYRYGWYISLTDQSGNLVVNQPLIGSPPNANIYLAPGAFTTSTLLYRVATNSFEIGP
jgi:hypothetical protein